MGEERQERRALAAIFHALGDLIEATETMGDRVQALTETVRQQGELLMSVDETQKTATEVLGQLKTVVGTLRTDLTLTLKNSQDRERQKAQALDTANTSLAALRAELDKDELDDTALNSRITQLEQALAAAQGAAAPAELVTSIQEAVSALGEIDASLDHVAASVPDTGTTPPTTDTGGGTGTPPAAGTPDPNAPTTAPPGASGATDAFGNPIPADTSGTPVPQDTSGTVPGTPGDASGGPAVSPDPNAPPMDATGVPATPFAGGGNLTPDAPGLDQQPNPGITGGGGVP